MGPDALGSRAPPSSLLPEPTALTTLLYGLVKNTSFSGGSKCKFRLDPGSGLALFFSLRTCRQRRATKLSWAAATTRWQRRHARLRVRTATLEPSKGIMRIWETSAVHLTDVPYTLEALEILRPRSKSVLNPKAECLRTSNLHRYAKYDTRGWIPMS